ncbi:MAG: helix-turn-helix transcriptional regulator [Pseudorhodobacter sp.]|nr:helix-turn-helix transcriptional regulator [Pseudorhodobacter sp.]
MKQPDPQRDTEPFTAQSRERDHKAEIVDRLYDVALDPIRLEQLLEVWEQHAAPLRMGLDEAAIELDDPDIEAHLGRARIFLDRFEATRADGGYRSVLADIPRCAAFVSDGFAAIAACNRAAVLAFGIADGAALTKLPFDADDTETLREVIGKVAAGRAEKVITLRIRSGLTGGPVILRVSPVQSDAPRPLALVLSTELVWPEGFEAMVQEAFALTPAEVEIVRGVTLGRPLREIAEARGRSVETVRAQLRSVLAKTETHAQSELVRVVLGLMDVSLLPSGAPALAPRNSGLVDLPFHRLQLPDGRRLDWIEFGAPDGAPCLYMHLDYGLIRWPAAAEAWARARRIRVIVPLRAGYGNSDLHDKQVDRLTGCTADYAAVLDHLGVTRVAVLALGADLRFAINLSLLRPGLVSGILGCAAQLPLRTAAQYDRMDKWQRFFLANARYAPRVLPFIVQAGFSLARRLGKEAFFTKVNGGSPADVQTFARAEVREAALLGSEVCIGDTWSAQEAFTRECLDSEKDWSAIVRACVVPVVLLQGDQDPQTPMQTIRELMLDFPKLEVSFLPQTGQLLFFKEWPLALEQLERFLPR